MHATAQEAIEETEQMLGIYAKVCEEELAIPVIKGRKTDKEKFAGAEATYTVEAMMHDGKALQSGTSHYFGDGFARAFEITFQDKENTLQYPHQTSWGMSTRIIGAIIMTHGDDRGLVLPPAVAPIQVIVVPIAQHKEGVLEKARGLAQEIGAFCRAKIDDSDNSPGWKFSQYEMKGVPLRLELGPKDIEANQCVLVRRDSGEKIVVALGDLATAIPQQLEAVRQGLYQKALENRKNRTFTAGSWEEILDLAEHQSGFIKTMWCGDAACEEKMKSDAGLTSRCMPLEQEKLGEVCPICGKPAKVSIVWGKQY